jgi:hypothetical protein
VEVVKPVQDNALSVVEEHVWVDPAAFGISAPFFKWEGILMLTKVLQVGYVARWSLLI